MLAVEVMTMSEDVEAIEELNKVVLRGRVSSAPLGRDLPSGSSIVSFRVAVVRSRTPMTAGSKQTSDWVDCVAWGSRPRKSVKSWNVGDTVEVEGALRRRFFNAGGAGPTSRVEIEVLKGRVVARVG
jgi:single-strand DNA-binding protein